MRHGTILTILAGLGILGLASCLLAAATTPGGVLLPEKSALTPTVPAKATPTAPAKAATPTAPAKAATGTASAKSPAVDMIMGQYSGNFTRVTGATDLAEAKVARLPSGGYTIFMTWPEDGKTQKLRWEAEAVEGVLEFGGEAAGLELDGKVANRKLDATIKGKYSGKFELAWEACKASSDGEAPTAGSDVLLPKADTMPAPSGTEWANGAWKIGTDGVMTSVDGSNATKKSYGGCRLHVEFLVPYEPTKQLKDRATAGVFFMGRYEIRLTDSFGLDPTMETCGAIPNVRPPRSSASYPPGQWQTLDVVFRAPKVEAGSIYKPGLITAVLNGAKMHDIVKVDKSTPGGIEGAPAETGPLVLQAHGQPIKFRNIWLLPLKESDLGGL
jgi:hypothetical protein